MHADNAKHCRATCNASKMCVPAHPPIFCGCSALSCPACNSTLARVLFVLGPRSRRFIDDEDDAHGWGSSSSADEEEEEGDEGLDDFVRREAEKPKLVTLKKPRSNENCFRTAVTCPKCHAEWGQHLKAEGQVHAFSKVGI